VSDEQRYRQVRERIRFHHDPESGDYHWNDPERNEAHLSYKEVAKEYQTGKQVRVALVLGP
jgi:hypothetical protein